MKKIVYIKKYPLSLYIGRPLYCEDCECLSDNTRLMILHGGTFFDHYIVPSSNLISSLYIKFHLILYFFSLLFIFSYPFQFPISKKESPYFYLNISRTSIHYFFHHICLLSLRPVISNQISHSSFLP